jgi:hypothetical protein
LNDAAATANPADQIERAQMGALLKKLSKGQPLTASQLEQLNAWQAKQNAPPEQPAKRGRKRKPIIPKIGPDSSARDVQMAVVAEARARVAAGRTLQNHHNRALRDAWLLEESLHLWPNLAAAAADCKVSTSTLRSFGEQGCPGITPHSPIPKAPVLLWLLEQAHTRGGDRGPTSEDERQLDMAYRRSKLAKLNNELVFDAEDRAHAGIIKSMSRVRHHLKHALPGALFDLIVAAKGDRVAAEQAIADRIESDLRRLEPQPPDRTTITEPEVQP